MSKLSFRARALDATKPMPIYRKTEVSDLPDYSVLNRAVPQMPTGMDKEEESEHHLQRAISAQQVYGDKKVMVIPVPEAELGVEYYNSIYRKNFKLPKQFIHNQAQALNSILEQEKPDYDLDSDDEKWILNTNKRTGLDISQSQFEEMLDRLEKSCGSQVSSLSLQEAKLLLKEDDELIKAVYDYWIKKRVKMSTSLLFQIRQERRDGSSSGDSYVAFRRRTEKMQTRKNRKNDEASYEKMLKLRRDLSRAVTILEMIKRREKAKRELLHLTLEIVEKRFQLKDFDGRIHKTARKEMIRRARTASGVLTNKHNIPPNNNHLKQQLPTKKQLKNEFKKLKYQKHKIKISSGQINRIPHKRIKLRHSENLSHSQVLKVNKSPLKPVQSLNDLEKELSYQEVVDKMHQYEFQSSDEDKPQSPLISASAAPLKEDAVEKKKNPDGRFAFKRKVGCKYLVPEEDLYGDQKWPWMCDDRHRYSLTTLTIPEKCVGFARRRMGRGGHMVLDRAYSPHTARFKELDLNPEYQHEHLPHSDKLEQLMEEIKHGRWRRYRPHKPTTPQHLTTEEHGSSTLHSNTDSSAVPLTLPQHCETTNTVTPAESKLTSDLLKAGCSYQRTSNNGGSSTSFLLQNLSKTNATVSQYSSNISASPHTLKLMSVVSSKARTSALINAMTTPTKCTSCGSVVRTSDTIVHTQARTNENGPLRHSIALTSASVSTTTSQITYAHLPKVLVASQQDNVTIPTFTTKVSMATTGNTAMVTLTPTSYMDGSRLLQGTAHNSNVMAFVQQQAQSMSRSPVTVPALLRITAPVSSQQEIQHVPKTFASSSAILTTGNKVHYTKTASGISLPLTSSNLQQTLTSKLTPQQQSQLIGQRSLSLSVNFPASLHKQLSASTKVVLSSHSGNSTSTTYNIQSVGKQKVNLNLVNSNQLLTLQPQDGSSDHLFNASSTVSPSMTASGIQTNFVSTMPNVLKIGTTCPKVSLQPITSAPLKQLSKADIKTQPTALGNTLTLLSSPQIRRNVKNINRTLNITSMKPQKSKQIVLSDTNILIPSNQNPAKSKSPPTVVLSRKPPDPPTNPTRSNSNDKRQNESKDNGINNNDAIRAASGKSNTQPMEVT